MFQDSADPLFVHLNKKYMDNMAQSGNWVDGVAVQAMARMLSKDLLIVTSMEISSSSGCLKNIIPGGIHSNQVSTNESSCLLLGHVGEYHYISLQPLDEQNSINDVDLNESEPMQSCLHTEHITVVPPNEATPVPSASVSDDVNSALQQGREVAQDYKWLEHVVVKVAQRQRVKCSACVMFSQHSKGPIPLICTTEGAEARADTIKNHNNAYCLSQQAMRYDPEIAVFECCSEGG